MKRVGGGVGWGRADGVDGVGWSGLVVTWMKVGDCGVCFGAAWLHNSPWQWWDRLSRSDPPGYGWLQTTATQDIGYTGYRIQPHNIKAIGYSHTGYRPRDTTTKGTGYINTRYRLQYSHTIPGLILPHRIQVTDTATQGTGYKRQPHWLEATGYSHTGYR